MNSGLENFEDYLSYCVDFFEIQFRETHLFERKCKAQSLYQEVYLFQINGNLNLSDYFHSVSTLAKSKLNHKKKKNNNNSDNSDFTPFLKCSHLLSHVFFHKSESIRSLKGTSKVNDLSQMYSDLSLLCLDALQMPRNTIHSLVCSKSPRHQCTLMRTAPKIMPSILLCQSVTSEADIGHRQQRLNLPTNIPLHFVSL